MRHPAGPPPGAAADAAPGSRARGSAGRRRGTEGEDAAAAAAGDLCVSAIKRVAREDGSGAEYVSSACHGPASTVWIGTGGRAATCGRAVMDVVVQFPLPPVRAADVAEVALDLVLSDASGGGTALALHGLGPRAVTPGGQYYPLADEDFYEPGRDLPPGHVLIDEAFAAAGMTANATASLTSAALRDYVRDQLDRASSGESTGHTALRLSPSEYHGCEFKCDVACRPKRYDVHPASLSLTISLRDGHSLLYTASKKPRMDIATLKEELDIVEDELAGMDGADAPAEEGVLHEVEEELVEEAVAEELGAIDEGVQEIEAHGGDAAAEKEGELDELALELTEEEKEEVAGEEDALDLFDEVEDVEERVEDAVAEATGDGREGQATGDLCVSWIKRTANGKNKLAYNPSPSCHGAGAKLHVGTGGRAATCGRGVTDLVVQFPLPRVAAADVAEVALDLVLSNASGGGVAVALHGLGPRAVTHGKYPLDAADFYEPSKRGEPPPSGHVLINEAFAATGLTANATVSLKSVKLRDYVRDQLEGGAASSGYTALRLSPRWYGGCHFKCDATCEIHLYTFDPANLSLTIALRDGHSLLYRAYQSPGLDATTLQEELDVLEDKIAGLDGAGAAQEEEALQAIEEGLLEEKVAEELDAVVEEETEGPEEPQDGAGAPEEEKELDELALKLTEEEAKVAEANEKLSQLEGQFDLLHQRGEEDVTQWKGWVAIPVVLLLAIVVYRKFKRGGGRESVMQMEPEEAKSGRGNNAFNDFTDDLRLEDEEQQEEHESTIV